MCKVFLVYEIQGRLVCRDQLGTLYERLSHEAIQDQTSAAGGELLYVSFHNTELAHLPYFVTLDHHKK